MRIKSAAEAEQARQAALTGESYLSIELPQDLGLDCGGYKWRQNQSHVDVFVPLPEGTSLQHIQVDLKPATIFVSVHERTILKGALYRDIKVEESTWFIQDGVLEMNLLKRNRRGRYEQGTTNADTFWRSVTKRAPENETLALEFPPNTYYWSFCEDEKPVPRLTGAERAKLLERRHKARMIEGPQGNGGEALQLLEA